MKRLPANSETILTRHFDGIVPERIDSYLSVGGYAGLRKALEIGPEATLGELKRAGLRARSRDTGCTADQWKVCASQPNPDKYILCNALDTEPDTAVHAFLMSGNPHAVIEGMMIGAVTVGASKGFLFLDKANPAIHALLVEALGQLENHVVFDGRLLDSDYRFDLALVLLEPAFMHGEKTALISCLEGKAPMARLVPPDVGVRGYRGCPTVVDSAETLANVAAILQKGSEWFAGFGTEKSRGTKLFSISGCMGNEGIVEVPFGTSLRTVLTDCCGGPAAGKEIKAVTLGGPSGICISAESLDIPLSFEQMEEMDALFGLGSIAAYDQGTCMVDVVARQLAFSAKESCGRCVMCREGTWQLQEIIRDATIGKTKSSDPEQITEMTNGMRAGALCSIGAHAANPLVSGLRHFGSEFDDHMKKKKCPALHCNKYITFHILPSACTGCGECVKVCGEDAIEGDEDMIHLIDPSSCTKCGKCHEVCQNIASAVVKAGPQKPMTPRKPVPVGSWKGR